MDDLSKLTKAELLKKCAELEITKCASKNKTQLIELIRVKISENGPENSLQNEIVSVADNCVIDVIDVSTNFTFIDLFCGIGGFHQALQNMGGKCVFASDIDANCRDTYEKNYGMMPDGDITKVDVANIKPFDILCAGFPCQPFSKAGHQRGFDDDRGNLFFHICRIVKHHNPRYLLLENVRNLSSHDDGNTWKVIYEHIDALGYYTYEIPLILNVLHFNIPQNRERVIIMCKRKDLDNLPPRPEVSKHPKTALTRPVSDFLCSPSETAKYKIDGKLKAVEGVWHTFIRILINRRIEMPKFPIWTDWWDNDFAISDPFYVKYTAWIDKNRVFYDENRAILEPWLTTSRQNENWHGAVRKFEWQAGDLGENDGMNTVLWSARGSGIRVKRCNYIPTLVAMAMVPVYGPESRKLAPRELLRLQSFPDQFQYHEKNVHKQVGNAVNVTMIERCARFLVLGEALFT